MRFFGFAISAYQNEGKNYNSDWYLFSQKNYVPKFENQYELWDNYNNIIPILVDLNVTAFRFSIEWSRIYKDKENIDYTSLRKYMEFVNNLKKKDIEPFITLWHFTNPIWFIEIGGWAYRENIEYFIEYVDTILKNFSKLDVKYYITVNEILNYIFLSYKVGAHHPFLSLSSLEDLKNLLSVMNNLKKASEEASKVIKEYGCYSIHTENISISKINLSKFLVIDLSQMTSFYLSLYPKNIDIYGINYYGEYKSVEDMHNRRNNLIIKRSLINFLKTLKKDVIFTEVGVNTDDEYHRYTSIKRFFYFAIKNEEKYRIKGVFIWTLYDNYEWDFGYNAKFGIMDRNLNKKDSYYSIKELFSRLKKYSSYTE